MTKVLTDEEINAMAVACTAFSDVADHFVLDQESFARAIEAAVLEKFGEPVAYQYETFGYMNEYAEAQDWYITYDPMHPSEYAFFNADTTRNVTPLYAIKKEGE